MTEQSLSARARARARQRSRFSDRTVLTPSEVAEARAPDGATAFSFGDPEPVMSRRELIDHVEVYKVGRWFEPPIPRRALSRAIDASPHHRSAVGFKVRQLLRDFIPHPWLSREAFEGIALDLEVMGDCYVERVENMRGGVAHLRRSLARFTRRGVEEGTFFFKPNLNDAHEFAKGSVLQVRLPSLDQEIYGVPEYLCALQSAFLNEAATLFRRKYYLNGSHAGYILYISDEKISEASLDNIRSQLKSGKGAGNFRSMLLHIPNGKEKGVQLLHPGEAAAKDEFLGIKGATRDDILAAHRVPPQMLGVVPQNNGGFGDVTKAARIYHEQETVPSQKRFLAINDWLREEVVRFGERDWGAGEG